VTRRLSWARRCGPLLLAGLLGACNVVQDFSPEHALDMPSSTEKGYAALAAGDNPTAVKWLTVALKDKPDDPYLTIDLAAADQRLGKFDDAQKLYQRLVDTAAGVVPETVDDPKLQGRDLAQVAAADLALCTACGMPDPALKGYQQFAAGDFAGAAASLEAGFKAKPDIYLQLDLGATAHRLGRDDAARLHYQGVADTAKQMKDQGASPVLHAKTMVEIAEADLAALGK
jgi:Flp pilus assembly protein TadD